MAQITCFHFSFLFHFLPLFRTYLCPCLAFIFCHLLSTFLPLLVTLTANISSQICFLSFQLFTQFSIFACHRNRYHFTSKLHQKFLWRSYLRLRPLPSCLYSNTFDIFEYQTHDVSALKTREQLAPVLCFLVQSSIFLGAFLFHAKATATGEGRLLMA